MVFNVIFEEEINMGDFKMLNTIRKVVFCEEARLLLRRRKNCSKPSKAFCTVDRRFADELLVACVPVKLTSAK